MLYVSGNCPPELLLGESTLADIAQMEHGMAAHMVPAALCYGATRDSVCRYAGVCHLHEALGSIRSMFIGYVLKNMFR